MDIWLTDCSVQLLHRKGRIKGETRGTDFLIRGGHQGNVRLDATLTSPGFTLLGPLRKKRHCQEAGVTDGF